MEVKRLRLLALEIFKAFNENCTFLLRTILKKNENSVSKKYDLKILLRKSVTFSDKIKILSTAYLEFSTKQLKLFT